MTNSEINLPNFAKGNSFIFKITFSVMWNHDFLTFKVDMVDITLKMKPPQTYLNAYNILIFMAGFFKRGKLGSFNRITFFNSTASTEQNPLSSSRLSHKKIYFFPAQIYKGKLQSIV